MRSLIINDERVDIDKQTSIGLNIQAYDVTKPADRYVSTSNAFSIPSTAANLKVIDFAGSPQRGSNAVYSYFECTYIVGNDILINKGTARVTSITNDRITMYVAAKSRFWNDLQNVSWAEFQELFIDWLIDNRALPNVDTPFVGSFTDFLDPYTTSTNGLHLPYFVSNLFGYNSLETVGNAKLNYVNGTTEALGGHFAVFISDIFKFIEEHFSVDIGANVSFPYNVMEDSIVNEMYVPFRNIDIFHLPTGFYFEYKEQLFLPDTTKVVDKNGKTLADFMRSFLQYFNCLIDENVETNGTTTIKIRRFDEISNSPEVDFSKNLEDGFTFKPEVDKLLQNNYITFDVYSDGDALTNAKYIQCFNENLENGGRDNSIIKIKSYIPAQFINAGSTVLDMSKNETLEKFSFFVSQSTSSVTVDSYSELGVMESALKQLPVARVYGIDGEYNTLASMYEYPEFYTIEKWLTFDQLQNLDFFAQYHIPKLGGYFFINKIKGFNPVSKRASKIELLKIK